MRDILIAMSYEVSATRKRPQNFDELAGQEFVSTTLRASIKSGRIAHAYLFSGPRGCGKTSTARILARALNCEQGPTDTPCGVCDSCVSIAKGSSIDVIEIDGASNTSVENIRQIKDEVLFPPNSSRYKIYIIDEVHMLSNSAFNALLKTIEEPPPYIIFMFATTELHKVPATIKSRCQQFTFRLFSIDTIQGLLSALAAELGIEADADALLWIAKEATGSMRDAYTIFDQVASFSGGHINAATIREKLGLVGSERISNLLSLCFASQREAALAALDDIFSSGVSVEQFVSDMLGYTRSLLFIKSGIRKESILGAPLADFPQSLTDSIREAQLERMLADFFDLYRNIRYSANPRWEIDLAVSRLCLIQEYISPEALSSVIRSLKKALLDGTALIPAARTMSDETSHHGTDAKPSPQENAAQKLQGAAQVSQGEAQVSQGEALESRGTAVDYASDDALKQAVLAAVGKDNVVLYSCLERSKNWREEDGKLTLLCYNNYDAGAVLAEAAFIAKTCAGITGKALKIVPIAASAARDGERNAALPDSPLKIVEKTFEGEEIR